VIVVADTGALYALVDRTDAWHDRVVTWWNKRARNVIVPSVVLPEVSYLLQTCIGPAAEQAFIQAVADGEFMIEPLEPDDIVRAADLLREHTDFPLGFVDAAVVATAERLGTREILTTDRRHFAVVKPLHARALVLIP
jgi:predicted nucleic acid-binding protein